MRVLAPQRLGSGTLEEWTGYRLVLMFGETRQLPIAILSRRRSTRRPGPCGPLPCGSSVGAWRRPTTESGGYWSVARALAYAQAAGCFSASQSDSYPNRRPDRLVCRGLSGSEPGSPIILDMSQLRTLEFGGRTLVSAWVLIGTFLALRETLGLSNFRALGALVLAGVAISILLGVLATTAFLAIPSPPFEFGPEYDRGDFLGVGGEGPVVILAVQPPLGITAGLDFNLGLVDAFIVSVHNPFSFRYFP